MSISGFGWFGLFLVFVGEIITFSGLMLGEPGSVVKHYIAGFGFIVFMVPGTVVFLRNS